MMRQGNILHSLDFSRVAYIDRVMQNRLDL
jgi:hypothetical protein